MIIVTGGAGFIGSCIIKKYNDMGREDILVVDRFEEDDKWLNLRSLKYQEFFHADEFLSPDLLQDIFQAGVEKVYHMGAISATTETDMDLLMKNNVEYSQVLFSFCADYNVPFCYASSAATYGDGAKGFNDDESKISSLLPLNRYGYSKHLFDEWVLKEEKKPSKWYGMKFFNVYGPNEYHKGSMKSVVAQAYSQIQEVGKVKLFKSHRDDYQDGGQLRDFVYVKDVVEAMYELMQENHIGKNGIYNLGTGKARSFQDLVEATFKALDLEPKINFIDMPEHLRDQYQYFTEANMTKLIHALPEFKFSSLEEGVSDYVQNYLNTDFKHLNSRGE